MSCLYRAEEVAAPYYIFKGAGAQVDIASIKGGNIPLGIIIFSSLGFEDSLVGIIIFFIIILRAP